MNANKASNSSILVNGIIGGVVASILNVVIYYISRALDVSFILPPRVEGELPLDLHPFGIIFASMVPAIGALLLLMLLDKTTRKPFPILIIISVIVLAISVYPLTLDLTTASRISMGLMHIVAAVSILWALRTSYK